MNSCAGGVPFRKRPVIGCKFSSYFFHLCLLWVSPVSSCSHRRWHIISSTNPALVQTATSSVASTWIKHSALCVATTWTTTTPVPECTFHSAFLGGRLLQTTTRRPVPIEQTCGSRLRSANKRCACFTKCTANSPVRLRPSFETQILSPAKQKPGDVWRSQKANKTSVYV